jgi:hypothetical protein
MRLTQPFTPIEPGEIDYFVFDFTSDIGPSTILSTNWTCTLAPYQTATDPTPQQRVLAATSETMIQLRSPFDGSLQTKIGFFSVATIGGMPHSATGATYILEAEVFLSDSRVLKLNTTLLCAAPGI